MRRSTRLQSPVRERIPPRYRMLLNRIERSICVPASGERIHLCALSSNGRQDEVAALHRSSSHQWARFQPMKNPRRCQSRHLQLSHSRSVSSAGWRAPFKMGVLADAYDERVDPRRWSLLRLPQPFGFLSLGESHGSVS